MGFIYFRAFVEIYILVGCVLDESSTDRSKCSRKVVNGRRLADANKSR